MGGARGNALLTSLVGAMLLVLLAVEGATIPLIGQLLSLHAFVGLLLLGPVALKLASAGYRLARYYRRNEDYLSLEPPASLTRFVLVTETNRHVQGDGYRIAVALLAVAAGLVTALVAYPLASPWFHGLAQ